ncbi:MAG: Glutamate-tRNA ligase [Candidatus Woesebacteria bacterium GW2011_GWC1_38_13]|uniref:Glutamate--tRNA ligase n=1 Tax=Candidatus Woesebacteria bacterium GW2011_GWC1_38_13 TaxID=1618583 RepID=A0A0G0IMB3_9BACT|nr:MAG: Glutamate-tRNA ligase [Candidatus Woesebacteria bacterium GW2011_GWC1_38_13]
MDKIRTRFAPSPTGSMHIGNLRTALYAYALAKYNNGDFILRIEDTDKKREKEGGVEEIKNLLHTFGILWDEYYVQSDRVIKGIYKKAVEKLVADGNAFYCRCEAKNAKEEGFSTQLRDPCRGKNFTSGAVKLKTPDNEEIFFDDYILGKKVTWDTSTIGDATLLKSDGYPTYHLAVVVDDTEMKISHVLRGHDWMPSTPIHLLVYKYLGYNVPNIGHLTDILDPEGGKLSKRKGSVSCEAFLKDGYLPEALLNFIMLLGWAPKDNKELFSLEEFVRLFDPGGFQIANPIFNREKLDWFNGQYIRNTQNSKLKTQIYELYKGKYSEELIEKVIPLVKERIVKLSEFEELAGFFFKEPEVDKKLLGENADAHLNSALEVLNKITYWKLDNINKGFMDEIGNRGYKTGNFFMDLRIAITGKKFTPPINESMEILGKEETLVRLEKVIKLIK